LVQPPEDRVAVATTPAAWPNALDVLPEGRCRFTVAPPRHFLYPAVLLLLAEEPRHGYALVDALNDLGLGRMDRPGVYRALADLESDDLVRVHDEPPIAGGMRHVHSITAKGMQVLESWMSVVSQERTCLDLVLQRYWYCNSRRLPGVDDGIHAPLDEVVLTEASEDTGVTVRFALRPQASSIVVEARSNIGPIAFSTDKVSGHIVVCLRDGLVQAEPAPSAHLEVEVSGLSSGNALYDGELMRRVDGRRFPSVSLDLQTLERMGEGNCYQVAGHATVHGVTRRLVGVVTATSTGGGAGARPGSSAARRRIVVAGEYVLDVRNFDMAVPATALLKIYPDVRLHLRLEGEATAEVAIGT
jgi:DNA-binding PadR family transcriptional regulator